MGAKTSMLISCSGNPREVLQSKPVLDREATIALAKRLFPLETLKELDDGSLSFTCPPNNELMIGCFAP